MAKAPEAPVAPEEIVFELERFERAEGRLTLSGRWFGVRGRRFVRPTLTLAGESERTRALADLEDKPWAAEDGEPWRASFPWDASGRIREPELSVAPDIMIQLPAPGAKRTRPQRLAAQPRREVMSASWSVAVGSTATVPLNPEPAEHEESAAQADPNRAAEPSPPASDPDALKAEVEVARAQLAEAERTATAATTELEALRRELSALQGQLEGTRHDVEGRSHELEALQAELSTAHDARETALRNAAQAEADREVALTRAGEVEAERDALAAEKARLTAALEESRSTAEQLNRQHDEVVAARGAALVMRGATQALPAHERHVGWLRRGAVVFVLLGIAFAVLIVLGTI